MKKYSDLVISKWNNELKIYNAFTFWQKIKLLFSNEITFKVDEIFIRLKNNDGLYYLKSVLNKKEQSSGEKK